MNEFEPRDDQQLEDAIQAAFSRSLTPPGDLAGRIRVAVHAESARERVRYRRRVFWRMGLSFACACLFGFTVTTGVRRRSRADDFIRIAPAAPSETASEMTLPTTRGSRSTAPAPLVLPRSTPAAVLVNDRGPVGPVEAAPRPPSVWTHSRHPVVEVPVQDDLERAGAPSSLRISVTDPNAREERSLQWNRDWREGGVHTDLHYNARPILTSGGN